MYSIHITKRMCTYIPVLSDSIVLLESQIFPAQLYPYSNKTMITVNQKNALTKSEAELCYHQ